MNTLQNFIKNIFLLLSFIFAAQNLAAMDKHFKALSGGYKLDEKENTQLSKANPKNKTKTAQQTPQRAQQFPGQACNFEGKKIETTQFTDEQFGKELKLIFKDSPAFPDFIRAWFNKTIDNNLYKTALFIISKPEYAKYLELNAIKAALLNLTANLKPADNPKKSFLAACLLKIKQAREATEKAKQEAIQNGHHDLI